MYLADKFLYAKILNSSQTFNNLSWKFNVINRVIPRTEKEITNESPSHSDSSSKEDNVSLKRDDYNEKKNPFTKSNRTNANR